jgi:hypothetical protein
MEPQRPRQHWSATTQVLDPQICRPRLANCEVRVSRSDKTVELFYEFYAQTRVGEKWLGVVVKYQPDEAFVVSPNPFRRQSSPRSLRCFGLSGPGSQFPAWPTHGTLRRYQKGELWYVRVLPAPGLEEDVVFTTPYLLIDRTRA